MPKGARNGNSNSVSANAKTRDYCAKCFTSFGSAEPRVTIAGREGKFHAHCADAIRIATNALLARPDARSRSYSEF